MMRLSRPKRENTGRACPFEHVHEEAEELAILKAFADEAEGYSSNWQYGEALIRDSHFEDCAGISRGHWRD